MPRAPARGSPSARAPSAARRSRAPVARPPSSVTRGSRAPVARPSNRLEPGRKPAPSALAPHGASAHRLTGASQYVGGSDPPGNCVWALVTVSEPIMDIRARAPARDRSTGSRMWRISHCRERVPESPNMSDSSQLPDLSEMSDLPHNVRIVRNVGSARFVPAGARAEGTGDRVFQQ